MVFKESGNKNVTMISGFEGQFQNKKKEKQCFELDFVILSADQKMIVQVELKAQLNDKQREKVKSQFQHGFEFFQRNEDIKKAEGWQHVKVLFAENLSSANICKKCQPYLLDCQSDLKSWLQSLFNPSTKGE